MKQTAETGTDGGEGKKSWQTNKTSTDLTHTLIKSVFCLLGFFNMSERQKQEVMAALDQRFLS